MFKPFDFVMEHCVLRERFVIAATPCFLFVAGFWSLAAGNLIGASLLFSWAFSATLSLPFFRGFGLVKLGLVGFSLLYTATLIMNAVNGGRGFLMSILVLAIVGLVHRLLFWLPFRIFELMIDNRFAMDYGLEVEFKESFDHYFETFRPNELLVTAKIKKWIKS